MKNKKEVELALKELQDEVKELLEMVQEDNKNKTKLLDYVSKITIKRRA